jgi:hypothetical protein
MNPLVADNLVDIRCGRECYPELSAAIRQLCAEWREDPANRRQKVVFARLSTSVDAALKNYRAELVAKGYRPHRGTCVSFSRYLHRRGRAATERKIVKLHRLLRRPLMLIERVGKRAGQNGFSLLSGTPTLQVVSQALSTLDALRSLTNIAASFRPRAKYVKGSEGAANIRKPWWNHLCRYCDKPTELEAFLAGAISIPRERYVLNPFLCREHRSRREGGCASSEYRRLRRNEPEFQRELEELTWASVRKGPREPGLKNNLLYQFRRKIVDDKNLYLDDDSELAKEAWKLVANGISDRKKIIVMLLCAGENASSIARQLNVTRQAVHKAVQTLPVHYRFDQLDMKQMRSSSISFGRLPYLERIQTIH